MTEPSTKNRRSSRRLSAKTNSKVICRKGMLDLGPNVALKLLDVSETGVRLLVRCPVNPGQQVSLELESVSHGRPVKCTGTAIWSVATAEGQCCVGVRLE